MQPFGDTHSLTRKSSRSENQKVKSGEVGVIDGGSEVYCYLMLPRPPRTAMRTQLETQLFEI